MFDDIQPEDAQHDVEAADDCNGQSGQEECVWMVFEAGHEVHAEDRGDPGRKGDAQIEDLHVEVQSDDLVTSLVLGRSC